MKNVKSISNQNKQYPPQDFTTTSRFTCTIPHNRSNLTKNPQPESMKLRNASVKCNQTRQWRCYEPVDFGDTYRFGLLKDLQAPYELKIVFGFCKSRRGTKGKANSTTFQTFAFSFFLLSF